MREAWAVDAARAEQRAQLAGDELEKRGLPRDLVPTAAGEQAALFDPTPRAPPRPRNGLPCARARSMQENTSLTCLPAAVAVMNRMT
ncbi:hypothetical protein ACVGVM_28510 (plasmid) [Pseudonocardia bannensis]|uniref:Uncharacterized protein n=1 Tax=Pseudonocardia bannensis TaxID=630973 RepID=A0A848DI04_9PSEU|nr:MULTISPECIES: hypothetical protein [Pseudonocardia]NMH92114.1 hypothetical protein [Pseudonocardia bannensis]